MLPDMLQHAERYVAVTNARMFGYEGRKWCCLFWFVGWDCLSLGLHVCVSAPNIEVHLPFGFVRMGVQSDWQSRPFMRGWCFFGWWGL